MKSNSLYLHERTKLIYDGIVKAPSNATLITGGVGSGKLYTALHLADIITGDSNTKQISRLLVVEPGENQSTTIDQIRDLSTKIYHNYTEPYVIIIKNAHFMTLEAQNAFLKILEEPPKNIYFILTCTHTSDILKTISSRCQELPIINFDTAKLTTLLSSTYPNIDPSTVKQTIMQFDSRIGSVIKSLERNMSDASEHDYTKISKQLLSASTGERFMYLQQYYNMPKSDILNLLNAMTVICKFMFENSTLTEKSPSDIKRWSNHLTLIDNTYKAIQNGGNTKIQLLNLMSSL